MIISWLPKNAFVLGILEVNKTVSRPVPCRRQQREKNVLMVETGRKIRQDVDSILMMTAENSDN